MGLADEILGLVADHVTAWLGDAGGRVWIPDVTRTRVALRARLTAIEQELASLRMDALQAESQRLGLYDDLDASHSFSALPCTSEYVNAQTGYDDEDGG